MCVVVSPPGLVMTSILSYLKLFPIIGFAPNGLIFKSFFSLFTCLFSSELVVMQGEFVLLEARVSFKDFLHYPSCLLRDGIILTCPIRRDLAQILLILLVRSWHNSHLSCPLEDGIIFTRPSSHELAQFCTIDGDQPRKKSGPLPCPKV